VAYYRVRNLEHLRDFVIPFFQKHSLKTRKRQEFLTFCEAAKLRLDLRELGKPRDVATLRKLAELGGRRNNRKQGKAAEKFRRIQEALRKLEDRVQPSGKLEGRTERNSLPGKFWPARKA